MDESTEPALESSEVLPMFPTLVWKVQLAREQHEVCRAAVLDVLASSTPAMPSLAHGESWQSGRALHEREELAELLGRIGRTVRGAIASLKIGDFAFRITGCWANANAPGASHRVHSHPNNFLSGVYYVQTGPGADTINFHDPRNQTGIIRPPVTELTAQNTDQAVVRVEDGTLLVFPAYVQHSVDPNERDDVRISVSFNVMFESFAETMSPPLW